MTTATLLHFFHHLAASFCSNMLLMDSPELTHLPEDQALSAESLCAPSQSKMVCLNGFPFLRLYRGAQGQMTSIYSFTTIIIQWTSCWCAICWLSIHLLLDLVRIARLGGHWLIPSEVARILMESWFIEFMVLVKRRQKRNLKC